MDYTKKYYVVIAANITDQDIEFSKKPNALPSYSIDIQSMMGNSMQAIMEFSESYKQWLATQDVELKKLNRIRYNVVPENNKGAE